MSINDYCKINDKTLHLLPFVASRKRKQNFKIEKQWGKWKLNLSAPETMNTIELITLSQMLQDYQRSPQLWAVAGNVDGEAVLKREIDVSEFVIAKGLPDKKGNRETVLRSIQRWYKAELNYTDIKDKSEYSTRYIYSFKNHNPKKITFVTINVNKGFLDFCLESGLMFNWKRLMLYRTGYAQLLDAFLQGTRDKRYSKKSASYYYREAYSEDILMAGIGLSDSGLEPKDRRRALKASFKEIHELGGIPEYVFDRAYGRWIRVDSRLISK